LWKWLSIEGWSNKISMLIPSWIRKMNIVLFERNALVDKSFVRSKAVDLLTLWCKSYITGIDGWYLDASFKTLFDKIAAELLWQKSWKVWTEVLSSRMKQFFFFERYAGVRLIQLSLVSSTPESADSRNFSGSKVFLLYKCWKCKKLYFSKFCKGAKLFKLFVILEINLKCFPSSKFEPRSFAKCLQNLLIEKKSVERL